MQRILDVRIVKWYFKLAYIVGAWLVGYVLQSLLELVNVHGPALVVVGSALSFIGILVGARIFRGRNELVLPPRAWWRMTARRPLSVVLGVIAVVSLVSSVAGLVGAVLGYASYERSLARLTIPGAVTNILWWALVAYLYLNSAARIPRQVSATPAPVESGPRSTASIVREVTRLLDAHGLSEQSPEIARALLIRGSVDRSDFRGDLMLTDAAWRVLLSELNATMTARS